MNATLWRLQNETSMRPCLGPYPRVGQVAGVQGVLEVREEEEMKWLVACECSAIVRDALRALGHDAWSCDLKPCERDPRWHIQGDVLGCLGMSWDGMIAHPECTHIAVSGSRHFPAKRADGRQQAAIAFFMRMVEAPINFICVENPVCIMSSLYRKPDQIIQPYQFGHAESKTTCLWLKGLPKLVPTKIMEPVWWKNPDGTDYKDAKGKRYSPTHYLMGRKQLARWENQTASGQNKLGPSPEPAAIRARTYPGVAAAIASQWGHLNFTSSPLPLFEHRPQFPQ